LIFQGDIALQRGDLDKARSVYQTNTTMLREIGNVFYGIPDSPPGVLALEQNDIPQAWNYFQESLALNQEVGDERAVCACLTSMAALAIHLDKSLVAVRLLGVVEHRLDSHRLNLLNQDQVDLGRLKSRLQTQLDEATFVATFSEGWGMSEAQAIELVEELFGSVDRRNRPCNCAFFCSLPSSLLPTLCG
jgi:hypothetical protein